MALGRFSVLVVWFLATPGVLGALGPERFGYWSILLVFTASLAALDLGLGVAVTRTVAAEMARGNVRGARWFVARALALQLAIGALAALILLLFREPILDGFHVDPAWRDSARLAFAYSAGSFVFVVTSNLLLATLQGLQRMDLAAPVAVPLALALFVGIGFAIRSADPLATLTFVQLLYTGSLSFGLGSLVVRTFMRGVANSTALGERLRLRTALRLGGLIQLSGLFGLLQAQVDKILLGTLVALAPVASYELGFRVNSAALLAPMMVLSALLPAASRVEAEAGPSRRVAFHQAALTPYFALCFGLSGALVALAPAILEAWLGVPPEGAVYFLQVLAIAQLGNLIGGVASTMLRSAGSLAIELEYAVFGTVVHIGLSLLFLRWLGPTGVVLGTSIGSLIGVSWFVFRVERWLGADAPGSTLRAAFPVATAAAVAGVAAFLVGAALPASPAGRTHGMLAFALGAVVFAVVDAAILRFVFPGVGHELETRVRRLLVRSTPA